MLLFGEGVLAHINLNKLNKCIPCSIDLNKRMSQGSSNVLLPHPKTHKATSQSLRQQCVTPCRDLNELGLSTGWIQILLAKTCVAEVLRMATWHKWPFSLQHLIKGDENQEHGGNTLRPCLPWQRDSSQHSSRYLTTCSTLQLLPAVAPTAQHCQSHSVCRLCRRVENQGLAMRRESAGFKQVQDAFVYKTLVV